MNSSTTKIKYENAYLFNPNSLSKLRFFLKKQKTAFKIGGCITMKL